MNWKKSIIVSISIIGLVCSEQVIQACTDYNSYDTYPQFFGNGIAGKPVYTPFYFVEDDLYYDSDSWFNSIDYADASEGINKKLMLEEWQNFTGKGINIGDIEDALYNGTMADFISFSSSKTNHSKWDKNNFVQWLTQRKNSATLDYLVYAKKCEAQAIQEEEDWSDQAKPKPTFSKASLQSEGMSAFQKEKAPFLKMKYAFQVLRMAFYEKKYADVLRLYDELLPNISDKSVAFTRALGFRAGAYFRLKDRANAGYYYTKMFDNSNAYKYEAMVSFEWATKQYNDNGEMLHNNFEDVYKKCQTDHERAVALVMKALRTFPESALSDIEKAYNLDPNVAGIDVLMNREINKLEAGYFKYKVYHQNGLDNSKIWYFNIRPYGYSPNINIDSLNASFGAEVKSLNQFSDRLIKDEKAGTPAMWHLTKAYLACMQNVPTQMKSEMAKAQSSGMNTNEKTVYDMVDLLYSLYQSENITSAVELEVLPKLKHLNQLAMKNEFANYQFRDVMNNLVAGKYFQQGDTAKGIYAMAHSVTWDSTRTDFEADIDFQDMQGEVLSSMSIASLNRIYDFRKKTEKNAFEQWLVSGTYYTPEVLKELEGTMYLRDYDFKSAAAIFAQKGLASNEFANPFMPQINDYIELYAQDTVKKFTKLSFSKRMSELQDIIAANPKDAGAMYGYAVALYNISYNGKSADMSSYNRIPTDYLGYYKQREDAKMPRYLTEYYRVYTAEQYFNKVFLATNDPELKAKALWGAAKCWTKRCPSDVKMEDRWDLDDNDYFINALKNPYFAKLKSGFSQTSFAQKVKSTCEYYSDYLKRR